VCLDAAVQVVTGKRWAPVCQDADQSPLLNVTVHLILGQVCETESRQGGVQSQGEVVEHTLALDTHFQLTPGFLEFPGIQAAVGGKAPSILPQLAHNPGYYAIIRRMALPQPARYEDHAIGVGSHPLASASLRRCVHYLN
jgi:hypothetical protein